MRLPNKRGWTILGLVALAYLIAWVALSYGPGWIRGWLA